MASFGNNSANRSDQDLEIPLEIDCMKGEYGKEELEPLRTFLHSLIQLEKRRALASWIQDHENSPEPAESERVQELKAVRDRLESLIEEAFQEGKAVKVDLPIRMSIGSPDR